MKVTCARIGESECMFLDNIPNGPETWPGRAGGTGLPVLQITPCTAPAIHKEHLNSRALSADLILLRAPIDHIEERHAHQIA